MTKLKACPFCNGLAELDKHENSDMHEIVYNGVTPEFATGPLEMELVRTNRIFIADVKCTKCKLVGKKCFSKVQQKSIDEAIEYWNTRYGKKPKQ